MAIRAVQLCCLSCSTVVEGLAYGTLSLRKGCCAPSVVFSLVPLLFQTREKCSGTKFKFFLGNESMSIVYVTHLLWAWQVPFIFVPLSQFSFFFFLLGPSLCTPPVFRWAGVCLLALQLWHTGCGTQEARCKCCFLVNGQPRKWLFSDLCETVYKRQSSHAWIFHL